MTDSGRVVLLDFGIVADVSPQVRQQRTRAIMGTIPYMAPEQAAGSQDVGPAADFYALGVVMYLALTGVMPYRGSPAEVLAAKQSATPPPPRSLVPGVPHDLDRLCLALLSVDPAARPSGPEILNRLRLQQTLEERSRAALPSVFVGRKNELAVLKEALASTRTGVGTTLLLYGESGIGKSFLVRSFTSAVVQENPDAVVLAGRCYERESVPFKAVDSVIDQLSEYLLSLPPQHAEVLLPKQMAALAQVFPVLSPLAARRTSATEPGELPAEVFELRRIAFVALRTLLQRIAVERQLVLVIDDLQWADADSLALLEELLRQPLPPPMLTLATVRTRRTSPEDLTEATRLRCLAAGVRQLHVAKLPESDARELVWQLLSSVSTEPNSAEAEALATEAAGHPLFIDELVRQRLLQSSEDSTPKLDDALWARVRRLPQPAQQLLELVAVAGVPIPLRVAAQAAVIEGERFDSLAALLRTAHLVRTTGVHMQDTIEPYHDRLRESVVAHLSAEARAQWHGRLAIALEHDEGTAPEALLHHWLEAGNRERAADYALRAAAHAESTLAFERAAQCYEKALSLRPVEGSERVRLYTRLGEALANASRGAASAEAFLQAMAASSSNDALRLKQRAAEQLLRSGHIDRGVALLRELLCALGLRYAETSHEALLQLLWYRARLRLRGLRFTPRREAEIPADELLRMDVCRAAAESLSMIDLIRGAGFRAQFSLLALQSGEPYRITLGTLLEASMMSASGEAGEQQAAAVMALSRQLAAASGSHHARAMVLLSDASIAHNLGRWRKGRELFDQTEAELRAHCTGVAWEVSTARYFSIRCSVYLGEFERVAARLDADLDEAAARGDLYMEICLRTTPVPRLELIRNRPEAARQALELAKQLMGGRDYPLQKYYLCSSAVDIDLYEGQGEAGYRRLERAFKHLRNGYLLRVQVLRIAVADQQARCALQVASTKEGAERRHWLALVERACALITHEKAAWAQPLALRHGAALCALRGEPERAAKLCAVATAALEAVELRMYAASLRYCHGQLVGGEEGTALRAQAEKELRSEGIQAPARWSAALHPGLGPSEKK